MPSSVKLLRVTAPHFVAGALFQRGLLREQECFHAAPILRWMVGMNPLDIKDYLVTKGWTWEWL